MRFNCHSIKSKQQSTGQRTINADKVPLDLTIEYCTFDEVNVYVNWKQLYERHEHQTVIPIEYLINNYPENNQFKTRGLYSHSQVSLASFFCFTV